jgi:hypothetical protein
MKNMVKLFGIIAFVAIIGFSFAACKKDALDRTTWKGNYDGQEMVIKFNSPNFTWTGAVVDNSPITFKGSYAISGLDVTIAAGDEEKLTGTLAGNTLIFTIGGVRITFIKK